MKKVLVIKFLIAASIFALCYFAKGYTTEEAKWLNNKVEYFLSHNTDFYAIADRTAENARSIIEMMANTGE